MSPAASNRPVLTDGKGLADARQRFLTFDNVEPKHVRDTILASWWRSRRWNVAADRIALSYTGEPDLDTSLTRSAMPVLRTLREHLESQPISVILTDASGVVLSRLDTGSELDPAPGQRPARPRFQLRRGIGGDQRDRDSPRGWPGDARVRP